MAASGDASGRRNGERRVPYWVGYGLTAGLLLAITAALVLVVLPSRYALVAELRESGISFPTSADAVAFPMPERETLITPPPPPVEREPGPSERVWAAVDSLLAAGDRGGAIDRMEDYLEIHPEDVSIRRERARTLANAGRPAAARAAFEDLVRRTDAPADRLALARLLRDAGEVDAAVALYRRLIDERPADLELRHELARLYMWAEQYGPAEDVLRSLVTDAPDAGRYRLDLARVLYWDDRPEEARATLADFPADDPRAREAEALDRELARLLTPPPEPEPPPPTLAELARRATAEGDFVSAAELYERAIVESPADSALAREHVDFLQYRLEDLDAAIAALHAYDERFGLDTDGRYRLAQLYLWTEQGPEARRILEALVRDHPERADAWSLLGDAYRYADERSSARDAYRHALALDGSDERAASGLAELDRLRSETIARREPLGVGPGVSLFTDSDDFLQLDAGGGMGWSAGPYAFDATAGYRRLEGVDLAGLPMDDRGGFATVEAARWWSEASLRTAIRLGVDHLDSAGTEPLIGLSVGRFGSSGSSLTLRYEHGPAYLQTYTLESALADVSADRLEVAAFSPLGARWSVSVAGELLKLATDETANTRLSGGVTLARQLDSWLTADIGTRLLGFTDAAPAPGRRLYWDPELFWSNTIGLAAAHRPERGLGYRLRLSGGAAWADERAALEAGWIPQFGAEAGLSWLTERTRLDLTTFYRRSREDEYSSFGAELTLRIQP